MGQWHATRRCAHVTRQAGCAGWPRGPVARRRVRQVHLPGRQPEARAAWPGQGHQRTRAWGKQHFAGLQHACLWALETAHIRQTPEARRQGSQGAGAWEIHQKRSPNTNRERGVKASLRAAQGRSGQCRFADGFCRVVLNDCSYIFAPWRARPDPTLKSLARAFVPRR
jgi:hypothetical protein